MKSQKNDKQRKEEEKNAEKMFKTARLYLG